MLPLSAGLVVYTERFAQCRDSYADLGLDFVEEQHGSGPVHVAGRHRVRDLRDGRVVELHIVAPGHREVMP